MQTNISDMNILNQFCEDFCHIVMQHAKYVIVSGFIAIASGRPRGTEDIDLILEKLSPQKFTKLHADLVNHAFVCIQSDDSKTLYEYLEHHDSIRYTRKHAFLPQMEVKFAKDRIDEQQLQHPVKLPLTGIDVLFGDLETNIAFKEAYLKSDKDLEDARHLRIVFKEQISEEKINKAKQLIQQLR